jgi:hypothetical protein
VRSIVAGTRAGGGAWTAASVIRAGTTARDVGRCRLRACRGLPRSISEAGPSRPGSADESRITGHGRRGHPRVSGREPRGARSARPRLRRPRERPRRPRAPGRGVPDHPHDQGDLGVPRVRRAGTADPRRRERAGPAARWLADAHAGDHPGAPGHGRPGARGPAHGRGHVRRAAVQTRRSRTRARRGRARRGTDPRRAGRDRAAGGTGRGRIALRASADRGAPIGPSGDRRAPPTRPRPTPRRRRRAPGSPMATSGSTSASSTSS